VIVVADVCTPRTFDLALRAAEGGRLVIAALNARSVHAAIVRALNFYPDYDVPRIRNSLAAVLNCVVRQQLVPDQTGTSQRLATELLVLDSSSRSVLRDGLLSRLQLLMNMEEGASGYGMDACLERMFKRGEIDLEEAFRHSDDKARFLRRTNAKAMVKN
jgi:twitching motility protein PilT